MGRSFQSFSANESAYERPTQKWVCGWVSEGDGACLLGPDHKGRCCALDPCRPMRQNDKWICGWAADGAPACLHGPDQDGRCRTAHMERPVTYACLPVHRHDRWHCTRSNSTGGQCAQGPLPSGVCCNPIPRCQPERSLLAKRGLVTRLVTSFTIGILLILLSGLTDLNRDLHKAFVSPGELTKHHAMLDCSDCHSAAGTDGETAGWLAAMLTSEPGRDNMILCVSCHNPAEGYGLKDHGLSSEELRSLSPDNESRSTFLWSLAALGPDVPRHDSGELACGICHQEHQGRNFEISQLDNQRCQTCHRIKITEFSKDHPEFSDTPFARRRLWDFNHGKHKNEHFGTTDAVFECANCHVPDAEGQNILVRNFEAICSDCHGLEMERQGVAFLFNKDVSISPRWKFSHESHQGHFDKSETNFACSGCHMPSPDLNNMLIGPFETTCAGACHHHIQQIQRSDEIEFFSLPYLDVEALRDRSIGQWPEDAAGEMTPFMKLLLSARPAVGEDLKRLSESGLYLDDLSEADEMSMAAAVRIVWAIKTLVHDLTTQEGKGPRPLDHEDNGFFTDRDRASLAEQFPIDAIRAARKLWLPELESELGRYRAGEAVDTAPFFINMDEIEEPDAPDGWTFEMSQFVGLYRPTGHADSMLRRWLDVTGRLYNRSDEAKEIFDLLGEPYSSGRCIVCHTTNGPKIREDSIKEIQLRKINWSERQLPFTRFTHRPHLDQACSACHQGEGFAPGITEESCATCHTSEKAGDSCLACHNYHLERFTLERGTPR